MYPLYHPRIAIKEAIKMFSYFLKGILRICYTIFFASSHNGQLFLAEILLPPVFLDFDALAKSLNIPLLSLSAILESVTK